jgi:hypothetical protein
MESVPSRRRGDDEFRLAFTTHDVLVSGAGLDSLLMDLAAQRIARLQQPSRAARSTDVIGPFIREVSVVRIEASREEDWRAILFFGSVLFTRTMSVR